MNRPAIAAYHLIPSVYDALIGPFLRAVAFTSGPSDPTDGNVFDTARIDAGASGTVLP
jgi:hypothetical protein